MADEPQQKPMDRDLARSHEVRRSLPIKKSVYRDHKVIG